MYKLLKAGKSNALSTERALKLADVGFVFDASGFRRGRRIIDDQAVLAHQPSQVVQDPYENQIHLNPHIQNMPQSHIQNLQNMGLMPTL